MEGYFQEVNDLQIVTVVTDKDWHGMYLWIG